MQKSILSLPSQGDKDRGKAIIAERMNPADSDREIV